MVNYGQDEEDTHESMQMRRVAHKYEIGKPQRHLGKNRLKHRDPGLGQDILTAPGE